MRWSYLQVLELGILSPVRKEPREEDRISFTYLLNHSVMSDARLMKGNGAVMDLHLSGGTKMREEYPLRPWAQKTKDAIENGFVATVLLGAFAGVYLFFINARLVADVLQAPAFFFGGPPAYVLFGAMTILFYFLAFNIFSHKVWLGIVGLDTVGLFSINLLWPGLFTDVLTFLILVLTVLSYFYREQIHDRIYDHSKPRVTRY